MMRRRTLLALAALAATPAWAQDPATPPAAPPAAKPNPRVRLETPEGSIVIELYADKAPVTAANYLRYVDRGLFNGSSFYRASQPPGCTANDYGVVQGGLQNDPKKLLAPIAHEPNTKTGILHTDGVISMGRYAPGTAQADWFICVGQMTYLDATATDPGFAAFGHVVEGMDTVKAILGMPTNPNAGTGAMKGEILMKPVKILTVRRVPAAA